jgi:hypothetical protein
MDVSGEDKAPELAIMELDGGGTRIWTNEVPPKRKEDKEESKSCHGDEQNRESRRIRGKCVSGC